MNLLSGLFGPSIQTISAQELQEKLKSGNRPFLIDVREPEEFKTGHISGARLIPLGQLSARMSELPKDAEIICICASGARSTSATKMLVGAGYNAINTNGGMFAWRSAGLPVKKD